MKKDKFYYIKNKDKKLKLDCYVIDVPIYKVKVKILLGKKALQLERDWSKPTSGFGGLCRNYLDDEGMVLVSFPSNKPRIDNVAHEFHHATDMIMGYVNHKKNSEGDEPSAYLLSYLMREFLRIKI